MERSVVSPWTHKPKVRSGKSAKSQDVMEVVNTTEDQGYVKK
jgi:hypothetical protein